MLAAAEPQLKFSKKDTCSKKDLRHPYHQVFILLEALFELTLGN